MTDPVRITLKQARTIDAVAKTRGLEHATRLLNMSQPVVSRTIAAAELALGVSLFQRGWSGTEPTVAGEAILKRCAAALQTIERAEDDIEAINGIRPNLKNFLRWHHLDAVSAVVQSGSASRASERLKMTQPAISRSIAATSQYARQALFRRRKDGLSPSAVARRLAVLRDELISELGAIDIDKLKSNAGLTGRLAVGMLPFSGQDFVARAFGELTNSYPDLRLMAVPGSYDMLARALARGEIDCMLGILREPMLYPDLRQVFLYNEKFTLVACKDHPCHASANSISDLKGEKWIVAPHGTPVRTYFESLFQSISTPPPAQTCEILSFSNAERVVAHSNSIALLSYSHWQVSNLPPDLKKVDVDLPECEIAIGLTLREHGSPADILEMFETLLRSYV